MSILHPILHCIDQCCSAIIKMIAQTFFIFVPDIAGPSYKHMSICMSTLIARLYHHSVHSSTDSIDHDCTVTVPVLSGSSCTKSSTRPNANLRYQEALDLHKWTKLMQLHLFACSVLPVIELACINTNIISKLPIAKTLQNLLKEKPICKFMQN